MSSDNFTCIGPRDILAYVHGDLRAATRSVFLIGPWLDGYVAQKMVAVAPRTLNVRVLVRVEHHQDPIARNRTATALSIFAGHWTDFEARALERLHAKCLCIDGRIVYVGSANWYQYSLEQALEVVLRGPVEAIMGLDEVLEKLWGQGELLKVSGEVGETGNQVAPGITYEVLDPLATEMLKQNPKAFVLGRKKRDIS